MADIKIFLHSSGSCFTVEEETHTRPPHLIDQIEHNPFHTGCWKQLTLQKVQLDKLTMDSKKKKNACGHPLCKMHFSGYQASQVCWDNRDGTCVKHSSSFPGFHTCCIGCSVNTSIISCARVTGLNQDGTYPLF